MLWKIFDNIDKVAAVGDTHAHLATLQALHSQVPTDYLLFSLGDMIDKGRRAREVVEYYKTHGDAILGNHDHLMTVENRPVWKRYESQWLRNNGSDSHRSYGGKWRIRNDEHRRQIFYNHVNWLKSLPLVAEFPKIIINGRPLVMSHSSLHKAVEMIGSLSELKNILTKSTHKDVLNLYVDNKNKDAFSQEIRAIHEIFWYHWGKDEVIPDLGVYNVFGHTVVENPIVSEHFAAIDTGVYNEKRDGKNWVKTGKLSCLLLPDVKIISQPSLEDEWLEKK